MRYLGILALAMAMADGVAPARAALIFDFSFTGNEGAFTSGTVTGEIFGLTDDTANEAATDLVIIEVPADFVLPDDPWDIFGAAGFTVSDNSFTVSGGAITAADFLEQGPPNVVFSLNASVGGSPPGRDSLQDLLNHQTTTDDGFAAISFTAGLPPIDIPEPTSLTLLLSGLFGLRMIRRRRG
jgi:hypothetical protein